MKNVLYISSAMFVLFLMNGVAMGNPEMLPNHPGYPAKGHSPVTGQSTANDPGEKNLSAKESLLESTVFYDEVSKSHATEEYPNVVSPKKQRGEAQGEQRSNVK